MGSGSSTPASPAPDALFRVDRLTKSYGRFRALVDVSFSVRAGEVLGLIGPNGSGKTTLFECLGGVLPWDNGRIQRDAPLSAAERAALLFYLPDAITPWPAQPVGWILDYIGGLFHGPAARRPEIVHRLGLEPVLTSRIGTLSKGQRKRALLGIGLLTPQPALLADEPFDGLDLRQTREVAETLRRAAGEGRTMFLSIHQIGDAARVCDRFILLSGGRVRGEGTAQELRALASRRTGRDPADLEEAFLALT